MAHIPAPITALPAAASSEASAPFVNQSALPNFPNAETDESLPRDPETESSPLRAITLISFPDLGDDSILQEDDTISRAVDTSAGQWSAA